jgi:hypothetical protein
MGQVISSELPWRFFDWKSFGPIGQISAQLQSKTDRFYAGFECVSGVRTIELDIHSHSALACP